MKGRRTDSVVVEGPKSCVRESEVELVVLLATNVHRLQADPFKREGSDNILRYTGPPNPETISTLQHGSKRRHEATGTGAPFLVTLRRREVHGKSVRYDDEFRRGERGGRERRRRRI